MALVRPDVITTIIDTTYLANSTLPPTITLGTLNGYHGRDYFTIALENYLWETHNRGIICDWCQKVFGSSSIKDPGTHWFVHGDRWHFTEEAHRTAFILRWT